MYTKPKTEALSCQYFSDYYYYYFAKLGGFCHVLAGANKSLNLQFTAEAKTSEAVFEKQPKVEGSCNFIFEIVVKKNWLCFFKKKPF